MYVDIMNNDETMLISDDIATKFSPVKFDTPVRITHNTTENTLTETIDMTSKETLENKNISQLQLKDEVFKVSYFTL